MLVRVFSPPQKPRWQGHIHMTQPVLPAMAPYVHVPPDTIHAGTSSTLIYIYIVYLCMYFQY